MPNQKHICIIGNGIAGITAARNIRKLSDHKITVISSESKFFYSRTALMYVYMGHMKQEHTKPYEDWFWAKNRIDLLYDLVTKIDFKQNEIHLKDSKSINYDELIIATGSKFNTFNWPGQQLEGVSGLYSLQDLANIETYTQNCNEATIVGGGLIGIELAEMLVSRKIKVNFLVRENHFWNNVLPENESKLIENEIRKHGINLILNSELNEIIGNENGKVIGIKTKNGDNLQSQFVGIAVGVSPNISFLQNADLETNRGVLVNEYLQTNWPNVYAIGDCAEQKYPVESRKPIEQIWYTGKIMGETIAKTLCGEPEKYEPGIFYNSAKFFDIDYSVYGIISPKSSDSQNTSEVNFDFKTFYWENENKNKCLRINFDPKTNHILGIHALGIRLRAKTCLTWLEQKADINIVLAELEKANFESEFSKNYLKEANKII